MRVTAADGRVDASGTPRAVDGPRLPALDGNRRPLRSLIGAVLARPWLDRTTLGILKHAYFPLSRLWAAADAAGGDADTFWRETGLPRRHDLRDRVADALARFETSKISARAIDNAWQAGFFGEAAMPVGQLVALETARHRHAHHFNLARRHFVFLRSRQVPRARLAIASPEEVAALHPQSERAAERFAPPAVMPQVAVSQSVPGPRSLDAWLRFASPSARLADVAWARVHTPYGQANPPTVILGHGICVEFDHWQGLIDETNALLARGIRVIRPEAPWHGRRRPAGYYGGERAIGSVPLGMVDLLVGAVREWSVLADWARQTSTGALAFAGTSLGALTAQLAASVAKDWPARLRPEALYLMTHSGDMAEAMVSGAVASLFADPAAVRARGWSDDLIRRQMAIIDPVGAPVMAPQRIVSVLGSHDVITPFAGGAALVARWGLPADNVFISKRGHFTVPMSLIRETRATERFADIVTGL